MLYVLCVAIFGCTTMISGAKTNPTHSLTKKLMEKLTKKMMEKARIKMDEDKFDSGIECVTACSKVTDIKWKVNFEYVVWRKIWALYSRINDKEWLAYLIGKKRDGEYDITDIAVPKQEVTGASVDVTGDISNPDIIGTVHSHVRMGTFFSQTDHDFAGSNWDVMVVVSNGDAKAQVRVMVPCGAFKQTEAEVLIYYPKVKSEDKFTENAVAMITEKKYTHAQSAFPGYLGRYGKAANRFYYDIMNAIDVELRKLGKPELSIEQRRKFALTQDFSTPVTIADENKLREEVGLDPVKEEVAVVTNPFLGGMCQGFGDDDIPPWMA